MPDGQMASITAVPIPPEFDSQIQSWDLAFKDKATSDYGVGQVWAAKGADRFLLDQHRERMDMPQTKQAIRTMSEKWPQAAAKLVEDKANGPAVIQELQHQIAGLIEVTPEGGKIARAHAVSPQAEAGNIYLPHLATCSWVDPFLEEATAFPNSRYDDQVDAMTKSLHRLRTILDVSAGEGGHQDGRLRDAPNGSFGPLRAHDSAGARKRGEVR
jgi:predicted phage terminase large subunit-like protein